jgi:ribose transport system ATP-binding protein
MAAVLKCVALTKAYPGVVALDGLDFEAEAGTIHAVLGENGAGKSTFIKSLGGTVRPDSGSIAIDGAPVAMASVRDARRLGIGVAYQELSLVPDLTVGQNIWLDKLGRNPLGLVGGRATTRRTEELLARLGAPSIDPRRKVKDLSIAARHVVEIVSSVATNPRILVLDEATAALPAAEARWALELAQRLAAQGTLVLFISHRLHECREIASRFTVLRRGKAIRSAAFADLRDEEIIEDMLGRKPRALYPPAVTPPRREPLLEVAHLHVADALHDVSLDLHAGEILGLGGLEGQGQSALMLALFGMQPCRGEIRVGGVPVQIRSPKQAFAAGVGLALVPEDRRYQGLHLDKSVRDNIALPVLSRLGRFGFIGRRRETSLAQQMAGELSIKLTSVDQPVRTLSGGNQQKVVIAKLLSVGAKILLFHDLTRGIDVGTKAEVFHLMRDLAAKGHAILFYSSENQELVNMCDRVLVLRGGRSMGTIAAASLSEERILQAAMGLAGSAVAA